jgi:hypothetical protein
MPGDPQQPMPSPPPDVIPNPVRPPTPQEAPKPELPPDIPAPGPDVIREPEPDDVPETFPPEDPPPVTFAACPGLAKAIRVPKERPARGPKMRPPRALITLGALVVMVAVDGGAAPGQEPPLPPPRPAELNPAPPREPAPQPALQTASEAAGPTCLAQLIAGGARAEATTAPTPSAEGCGIASPIRLSSVMLANGDAVSLPDQPVLDCEFATVLADYVRLIVAPLGLAMLHAKVAAIETGPGYDCRTQDRVAEAKISAHAKGLAVDFVAIAFADKRRLLVERQTGADETSYFRAVRTAACGWFTTVLSPGADAFHANNMHLDVERHGSSASYRICE